MATTTHDMMSNHRDLVSRLIQTDSEAAEVILRLYVLTDSTPRGQAIRNDVMRFAYSFTDHCRESMENFLAA